MASSVSQLNNYTNFSLFSFDNKDLLMKGMLMKQNAIDENRAKLQQMRDQMANFSVAKDVDRKYLEERLVQTTDIINKYSAGDLSNPNLMNQLASKFEEVVDDRVLNAVASASLMSREDKEWKAKEGTAEYSDKNRQYAMQNRVKYMQDENVGAMYAGGGGFVKYTDVDAIYTSKDFQDFLKNSNIKAEYIKNEDGSGYFRAINKYEGVDPQRLQQAIDSFLGEDGRKQLQINAWGKYGDPTTEENIRRVKDDYTSLIANDTKEVEARLDALDTYLQGDNVPPEQRAEYEDRKEGLEKQLTSLNSKDFNSLVTNPDGTLNEGAFKNLYTSVYEQDFMKDKFNLLYHDPIWKDSKIDEVQFKTAEYLETKRMHDLEFQKEARYAQKDMWEMQGKPMLNPDGSYKTDQFGNPIYLNKNAASSASTGGVNGMPGGNTTILMRGQDVEVDKETEATDQDLKENYRKEYRELVNNIRLDQKNQWDENSTTALEKWMIGNDLALGEKIKLSTGRTITVTEQNLPYLERLKAMTSKDNSTIRETRVALRELQRGYNSAIDQRFMTPEGLKEIPAIGDDIGNFTFIEKNGNLIYQEGKTYSKEGANNFAYLMAKKALGRTLTRAEDFTLKTCKTMALLRDPNISTFEKEQLYRAYKLDLNPSTANTMPSFAEATRSRVQLQRYMNVSKINLNSVGGAIQAYKEQVVNSLYDSIRPKEITIDKKAEYFTSYEKTRDAILSNARQVIHKTQFTILPESMSNDKNQKIKDKATREAIRTRVGLPADYKGDIRFERDIKDAKATDEFTVYYDVVTKKDGNKSTTSTPLEIKIKQKDLEGFGLNIDSGKFTPFDASLKEEAETLNLKPSSNLFNINALRSGNTNANEVFTEPAKQILKGVQEEMRVRLKAPDFDIFKELSNPAYFKQNLSYVPIDGVYYLMNNKGEQVQVSADGYGGRYGKLLDEDIVNIKNASDHIILQNIERTIKNKYNLD